MRLDNRVPHETSAKASIIVERTFAWISKHRRTVRDYERLPASHEAMILWATVIIMTRRLARYETGTPAEPRWGSERPRPGQPGQAAQAA